MRRAAARLHGAANRVVVRPRGARRHLAPGLDLETFFDLLKQRGVSYVVLRWFDALPHVDPGEDIDLLVADEDLPYVHSLMSPGASLRHTQKFDIYSVSGLPGSDFKGVPYYPPRFAAALLERGTWLRGRYRVPSLQDHHDSLAYHAAYHKGYASGLSTDGAGNAVVPTSDHDYETVLADLGRRLGVTDRPTLESLDGYLAQRDLRPPLDTLERLEPTNPWIADRFLAGRQQVEDVWRGLAVFVLRERARTQVDVAVSELDRQGFEVLEVIELDQAQQESASHRIRGGNWGRGPWPLSGGPPSTYVVAYDLVPDVDASAPLRADNRRIPRAKEQLRVRLLEGVAPAGQYNPVHSSDNPGQALDYLDALGDPDAERRLRTLAQRLVDSCTFPYPVVQSLSGLARRAQVAVVQHPAHGRCVCKVFRPGAARFFERELRARTELVDLPEVPRLLDHGERWLISPLYSDDRSHVRGPLPGSPDVQLTPSTTRALTRVAVTLHERGLFLLDLSTRNLLSDPVEGLKIVDFEFLQEYAGPVPDLIDSYTFWGTPPGAQGYDAPLLRPRGRPRGPAEPASRPNSVFHSGVTGSSVAALLEPERPFDGLRRSIVQLAWYRLLWGQVQLRETRRRLQGSPWVRGLKLLLRLGTRLARRLRRPARR